MILSKQLAVRVLRRAFKWHVAKIKDIAVSENWVHRQTCYLNREDDVNCKAKAHFGFLKTISLLRFSRENGLLQETPDRITEPLTQQDVIKSR